MTQLFSNFQDRVTPASQFGSMVRFIRKSRKLKIWQVAERVDIEVKHLGRIERGERQPSFDLIISLAKCLDVSPSRFFDFDSLSDPRTLRKNIDQQLASLNGKQLSQVRQFLSSLL